jgi:hypothetical protein
MTELSKEVEIIKKLCEFMKSTAERTQLELEEEYRSGVRNRIELMKEISFKEGCIVVADTILVTIESFEKEEK